MDDLLDAALKRLYGRRSLGIKPGLDAEKALLAHLGDPQLAYGVVHVAGTNGKGSVCALLSSILKSGGVKVGLFTSPHLVRFNERFRVDEADIDDGDLADEIAQIEKVSSEVAGQVGREATFFECATAIALDFFRNQSVQLALVETGMGGRLDATNVVCPLVSVITRVSLEHVDYLGGDLVSIAREKAGIVKSGRPVVCGAMPPAAQRVVREVAEERGCALVDAAERVSVTVKSRSLEGQKVTVESMGASYGSFEVPLVGDRQLENLSTAVATVETLNDVYGLGISEECVTAGAGAIRWPGRCQLLKSEPVMIVDGAHNPGAAESLCAVLDQLLEGRALGLVVGMCEDKDVRGILKPFSRAVRRAWIVPIASERSMPSPRIRAQAQRLGWEVVEMDLAAALCEAEAWARDSGGAVCVAGSLYLAGEVLGLQAAATGRSA